MAELMVDVTVPDVKFRVLEQALVYAETYLDLVVLRTGKVSGEIAPSPMNLVMTKDASVNIEESCNSTCKLIKEIHCFAALSRHGLCHCQMRKSWLVSTHCSWSKSILGH